jgi:hypothetical protein
LEKHAIDWSSARVEPIGEFYELHVQLETPHASQGWTDALNNEGARQLKEARRQPWGIVSMWDNTIVVHELEAGAEEQLRAHLDYLLAASSQLANDKSEAKPSRDAAEEAQGRYETAEGMAAAFRRHPG